MFSLKRLISFVFMVIQLQRALVFSVLVECNFDVEEHENAEALYTCTVENVIYVVSENTSVQFIGDHHNSTFNNKDVGAISADYHKMIFFPKSIEQTFPNLKVIFFNDGPLSKISQSDLKPFAELKILDLYENHLEVIEKDLFAFNLELEAIWLSHNKIYEVHPEVFDHLTKLTALRLDGNWCKTTSTSDKAKIPEILAEMKKNCAPGAYNGTYKPNVHIMGISDKDQHLVTIEKSLKECEQFSARVSHILTHNVQVLHENRKLIGENLKLTTENEELLGRNANAVSRLKRTVNAQKIVIGLLVFLAVVFGTIIFVGYRKQKIYQLGCGPRVSMMNLVT